MSIPANNGKVVLITGINGYIGSKIGLDALSRGYSIRGTSRSTASTHALLAGPFGPYADRVEIFEVPDITAPKAFDTAVKGVHGIFHVASPVNFALNTWDTVVVPAIGGTNTLLTSALEQAGSQLEAVIITSSVAALWNPGTPEGYVTTEADENTWAIEAAKNVDADGIPEAQRGNIMYSASKAAALCAVWEFRETRKPPFSVVTIHPSIVIGPPVLVPSSPSKLNETLKPLYSIFAGSTGILPARFGSGATIDVRDVSRVHLWAYENHTVADGEKYIASSGIGPNQAIADVLRAEYPERKNIPVGDPETGYVFKKDANGRIIEISHFPGTSRISGQKAVEATGREWIGFPQSILDTAKALESLNGGD
ncbi:hypothetical protein ACLOAV_004694 [Pseudogymnoascus australis]